MSVAIPPPFVKTPQTDLLSNVSKNKTITCCEPLTQGHTLMSSLSFAAGLAFGCYTPPPLEVYLLYYWSTSLSNFLRKGVGGGGERNGPIPGKAQVYFSPPFILTLCWLLGHSMETEADSPLIILWTLFYTIALWSVCQMPVTLLIWWWHLSVCFSLSFQNLGFIRKPVCV